MRLRLDYPAIVSGRDVGGNPRHALCRIPEEFEIPEYTFGEMKVPFTILRDTDNGKDEHITSIGSHLYRRFELFAPLEEALSRGGNFWRYVYQTKAFEGFAGLEETVREAAREYGHQVENLTRPVTRGERAYGWTERSMGCFKAPTLRNWGWLEADTHERIGEWRRKAEAALSNFIFVDGSVWKRCHEPTLELTLGNISLSNVTASDRGVYQPTYAGPTFTDAGLLQMGHRALTPNFHVFSPLDFDEAIEFSVACGAAVPKPVNGVAVHDTAAVSDDYTGLEAMRFARYLLAVTAAKSVKDPTPPLESALDALREGILAFQCGQIDCEGLLPVMETALEAVEATPGGARTSRVMIEQFHTRLDREPVHFPTVAF